MIILIIIVIITITTTAINIAIEVIITITIVIIIIPQADSFLHFCSNKNQDYFVSNSLSPHALVFMFAARRKSI